MLDPFLEAGFDLVQMTKAINLVPNKYGKISNMGLFSQGSLTSRSAIIERQGSSLRLLPTRPVGAPATMAGRDTSSLHSFVVPHIPHNDVVTASEVSGKRAFGTENQLETLANMLNKQLTKMTAKHFQTREFMLVQALKGLVRDGAGKTLINYYDAFDIDKKVIDFKLGDANTNVPQKCRELVRYIDDNLDGEVRTGIRCEVSSEFWDAFIEHKSVKDAYQFYAAANGADPNRVDTRAGFTFHGVTFAEYNATFTLSSKATEKAFAGKSGAGFPLGTVETFSIEYAPADTVETVNTDGQPLYAWTDQINRRQTQIETESNPLPMVTRPQLCVEVKSS